ncbi:MAG: hypothetical protein KF864_08080 [Phycisphaeraceae bacterium]|nr:hypothetical protein [Phycisphaeraceae bacterium]MBX3409137.1 hypothetical protein [Phycisphaeraceae bacterium]
MTTRTTPALSLIDALSRQHTALVELTDVTRLQLDALRSGDDDAAADAAGKRDALVIAAVHWGRRAADAVADEPEISLAQIKRADDLIASIERLRDEATRLSDEALSALRRRRDQIAGELSLADQGAHAARVYGVSRPAATPRYQDLAG